MAERRLTVTDGVRTARAIALFFDGVTPVVPSGWHVQDATDSVLQPFYAALDIEQRLCWTDDPDRAELFDTKQAAERFAVDRLTSEARIVPCS